MSPTKACAAPSGLLTQGRGFDTRNHRLAVFGGAGGQHACSIACNLRIGTVIIHKYSSILSASGMALAEVVHEALEPSSEVLTAELFPRLRERLAALQDNVRNELLEQRFDDRHLRYERFLNMRYQGTDTLLMIMEPADGDFEAAFPAYDLRKFTFTVPGRPILVDAIRVRGIAADGTLGEEVDLIGQLAAARKEAVSVEKLNPRDVAEVYFEETKRVRTPVYVLSELPKASVVPVCRSTHIAIVSHHDRALRLSSTRPKPLPFCPVRVQLF